MRAGQVERLTYHDQRHGTTSLFAALDVATGKVIGEVRRRHRSTESRRFLDRKDAEVPTDSGSECGDHEPARARRKYVLRRMHRRAPLQGWCLGRQSPQETLRRHQLICGYGVWWSGRS
jgi:hypothetical protein